ADLGKNYFELFGLPVSFDIDPADLSSRYRELQRRFHPDRYASAMESERRLAMQMTSQINAAHQTLRDPVLRGRYLLGLQGVMTDEETDTRMEPAFLMEQMELREALDEARTASDRADRLQVLGNRATAQFEQRRNQLRDVLSAPANTGYQKARNLVREMQFLQKISREIEELE
ncbi:MAG: Fe-S protein assembly co-chaperone HscB, partial [Gammaproteobacteria bacterium]|nr:Fe-S protein assembly co-chaperone HscB [Gammaproteobacteria bacterium]